MLKRILSRSLSLCRLWSQAHKILKTNKNYLQFVLFTFIYYFMCFCPSISVFPLHANGNDSRAELDLTNAKQRKTNQQSHQDRMNSALFFVLHFRDILIRHTQVFNLFALADERRLQFRLVRFGLFVCLCMHEKQWKRHTERMPSFLLLFELCIRIRRTIFFVCVRLF